MSYCTRYKIVILIRCRLPSIHPLSVTALSLLWGHRGCCWIPAVSRRRQGTPWTSRPLIAEPSLMAEAAMQGANCTSGTVWSSVSCSRTLRHAANFSSELGFGPATFQPLADLLYPLSYSCSSVLTYEYKKKKSSHLHLNVNYKNNSNRFSGQNLSLNFGFMPTN